MEILESSFQFKAPVLEKIEFIVNNSFSNKEFEGFSSIKSDLDITRSKESAKVSMFLEIGEPNEEYPFYVKIEMSSRFKWVNSSDDQIEGYLNVNAPALLLSYMRPIVANITNSSKYEVLNLPFVNFAETFEKRVLVDDDQPAE